MDKLFEIQIYLFLIAAGWVYHFVVDLQPYNAFHHPQIRPRLAYFGVHQMLFYPINGQNKKLFKAKMNNMCAIVRLLFHESYDFNFNYYNIIANLKSVPKTMVTVHGRGMYSNNWNTNHDFHGKKKQINNNFKQLINYYKNNEPFENRICWYRIEGERCRQFVAIERESIGHFGC